VASSDHDRRGHTDCRSRVLDHQTHDALCDLHACVLVLDNERRRLSRRLDAVSPLGVALLGRADLERRHEELTEELAALHATIKRLRARVDPESKFL
jgi:ABC-type phosphate transport system auxiliary subunit